MYKSRVSNTGKSCLLTVTGEHLALIKRPDVSVLVMKNTFCSDWFSETYVDIIP